jgi:hypothetical protein
MGRRRTDTAPARSDKIAAVEQGGDPFGRTLTSTEVGTRRRRAPAAR